MSTQIPWFRYSVRELKRQIQYCTQRRAHWWDAAEWRDALHRAQRLQKERRRKAPRCKVEE